MHPMGGRQDNNTEQHLNNQWATYVTVAQDGRPSVVPCDLVGIKYKLLDPGHQPEKELIYRL